MFQSSSADVGAESSAPKLINYTSHPVVLKLEEKEEPFYMYPSEGVVRCESREQELNADLSEAFGFPIVTSPEFIGVSGMPLERDDGNTGLIVSTIVAQYLSLIKPRLWKGPVFSSDSDYNVIRICDSQEQIYAVRRLVVHPWVG